MQLTHSETKVFRPDKMQFIINELHLLFLLAAGIIYCGLRDTLMVDLVKVLCLLLAVYLIYQFIYLTKSRYTLTEEQFIYERGIITRRVDFIELYRIIDFKENRSFLQQITGLKTIVIYSGDRTHPRLLLPGIHYRIPLVSLLRERVEQNKKKRFIYEITNR
jgi:uncharacterized membrane protein YdbT with pleckstrin-like domain